MQEGGSRGGACAPHSLFPANGFGGKYPAGANATPLPTPSQAKAPPWINTALILNASINPGARPSGQASPTPAH